MVEHPPPWGPDDVTSTGRVQAPPVRNAPSTSASDADTTADPAAATGATPPAPGPSTSPSGRNQWAHLRLLAEIGRGGYGRVYRAWDPALDREVALKIVALPDATPDSVATLLREGRMLARVRHQNVVTVHGAQQVGNEVGIWMELVRGRSLGEIVAHDGPLGAEEAAVTAVGLCRALAAVHAEGLVHRDVKAQNVMRESGGRIVLMDFGTGRDLGAEEHSDAVGTPLYMAPEVLAGEPASAASDIYSAGVVLFFLVTGEYPAVGRSMVDLVVAHAQRRQRLLADIRPDLPERFIRIVERALAPAPADRYPSAGAMLRDLQEVTPLGERYTPAPASQPPTPRSPTVHRPRQRSSRGPVTRHDVGTPRRRRAPASRPLAFVSGAVVGTGVLLLGLGWLCTAAFNTSLQRPPEFAHDSLADVVVWGMRSLVAPLFYGLAVLAPLALLRIGWRLTSTVSARAGSFSHRAGAALASFLARQGRLEGLGVALVALQLAALAVVVWAYSDLIAAFTSIITIVAPETLAPLRPDAIATRQDFRLTLSALTACSLVAWVWLVRRWSPAALAGGWTTPVVGGLLVLATLVLMTLPYRTFYHNEFEKVGYDGLRCYVLGEQDDRLLLHCPDAAAPRNRVVARDDSRLAKSVRQFESVFTPAAPSGER
jgi:serine/threonine-protein kinase